MSIEKLPLKKFVVSLTTIDASASGSHSATVLGVKGIRAARFVLGDAVNATLQRSKATWDEAMTVLGEGGTVVIGSADTEETASKAARSAETESQGVLGVQVGQNTESPETASSDLTEGVVEIECDIHQIEMCADCGMATTTVQDGPDACQHNRESTFKDAILLDDFLAGAVTAGTASHDGPALDAVAYALTAMAIANGNGSMALTICRAFGRHRDPETWGTAGGMIRMAFEL